MNKWLIALLIGCLSLSSIEACGPRGSVHIFYSRDSGQSPGNNYGQYGDITKPYIDLKEYVQGDLGVIRPQYSTLFLFIAYRYLTNKPLSSEEVSLLLKLEGEQDNRPSPIDWEKKWVEACSIILKEKQDSISGYTTATIQKGGNTQLVSFENCTNSAFQYAFNHLKYLQKTHGSQSNILLEWIRSQQQVFKNCQPKKPEPILPATLSNTATVEQKNDYDYQVACSYFYGMDYEQSAKLFKNIAHTPTSLHKDIALYLVFRSYFRDIIYKGASKKSFREAYEELQTAIKQSPYMDDIRGLYNSIKFQGEPEAASTYIVGELSKGLKASLLRDLCYLVRSQKKWGEGEQKLKNEFWEWRRLFRSKYSYNQALEHWRKNNSPLWLIVVLEKVPSDSKDIAELMKAAEAIPETSPAYLTIRYQMARLSLLSGDKKSAAPIVNSVLNRPLSLSTKNRFLDLKASLAKNFEEFLESILQEPVDVDETEYNRNYFSTFLLGSKNGTSHKNLGRDFDWEHFYKVQKIPISALRQAAESSNTPREVQTRLLIAAWVRCVLLDKMSDAKEIAEKLIETEPDLAEALTLFVKETNAQRQRYIAHLLIARLPSFSIFVYPKTWRNKGQGPSRHNLTQEEIDRTSGLRENWWKDSELKAAENSPTPSFLNPEEALKTKQEFEQLVGKIAKKTDYFCKLVIKWFKEMPHDPYLPEMMHRCVQMSRYTYGPYSSYEVFEVLHKNFPHSEYAKKSRYHYWHKENPEPEGD